MPNQPFVIADVFTETRFGGNQLAVFLDARGLSDAERRCAHQRARDLEGGEGARGASRGLTGASALASDARK